MKNLMRLMEEKSKSQKKMMPLEKDAKMQAVKAMRQMASEEMAMPLKNLKKVSVAADSEEGLKEGLEKAEEIVEQGMPKESMSEEYEDSEEMSEDMHEMPEEMSLEEVESKIAKLEALKKDLQLKKM
jgi:hypothetical protein